MGVTSFAVSGAVLGALTQVYTWAIMKQPLLKEPWRHAACALVGAGAGAFVFYDEIKQTKHVKALIAKRST